MVIESRENPTTGETEFRTWTPTDRDLEWSKMLFDHLKDNGQWTMGTGDYVDLYHGDKELDPALIGNTRATFTKKGKELHLTDIHIEDMKLSECLMNRIAMTKICFEKIGVPCKTDNSVDTAFVDMVSKK